MVVIGLTGGFLSGKSTVAKFFKEKGTVVISADKIYHELLLRDKYLKNKLTKEFGEDLIIQGRINRRKIKERALTKAGLKKLKSITHPYIIKELKKRISFYKKKVKFLVVETPLLYEADLARLFDKIIVVSSSLRLQLKRAVNLGYSREEALSLIKSQLPLIKKEKLADFIIRNYGTLETLRKNIDKVYKEIM